MKKRILYFIILSFLSTAIPSMAFAQEDENNEQDSVEVELPKKEKKRRGFIGFSAGPAFPIGNYGSEDWNQDKSGFTDMGYHFTAIDFGYKFVPSFGLSLAFKGANIPMNLQEIANNYAQEYGGQFSVKSTRWNYGGIYVGPIVSIVPSKFFEIDFRFQTGLMLAFSPELEVTRGAEYTKQDGAIGPSISVTLGAGARVHFSKRFSATVAVEYLRARPTFTVEYSSNNSFESETVYQDITTVNASVGLALRIF